MTKTGFHNESLERDRKQVDDFASEALAQAIAQRDEAARKEAEIQAKHEALKAEHEKNKALASERGF